MSAESRRSGFALALAIWMLAAIGGLAGASAFAVREASRTAARFSRQEEAAATADSGLFATLASWEAAARDSIPVGGTDSSIAAGAERADAYVTRITADLFSVTSVGRSAVGTSVEAQRAHDLRVTVIRPQLALRAAIVSAGDVVVGRSTTISGLDRPPPDWTDCPPPDSFPAPAAILQPGRTASYEDGTEFAGAVIDSLAADSATYRSFGPATAAFLTGHADITLPAGAMVSPHPDPSGSCLSESGTMNWGEPLRLAASAGCRRFFPVIHARGDIVVTAGRGQGLLLVDGRLRIDGPFVFYGVIIAARGIETVGDAVSLYGAVLSGSANGVAWTAGGEVRRSTCTIARALSGASRPVPIRRRAMSQLF